MIAGRIDGFMRSLCEKMEQFSVKDSALQIFNGRKGDSVVSD